jgi:hypothetical protein
MSGTARCVEGAALSYKVRMAKNGVSNLLNPAPFLKIKQWMSLDISNTFIANYGNPLERATRVLNTYITIVQNPFKLVNNWFCSPLFFGLLKFQEHISSSALGKRPENAPQYRPPISFDLISR